MPNWDEIRKEWETSKITLAALAEKHGVKLGTLKSRKSREGWSRSSPKKDATKDKKVATNQNVDKARPRQKNRSGNPNPTHKFPKHNSFAEKHGFYKRVLPEELINMFDEVESKISEVDMLWDQIKLQYLAIMRSQSIMFVESKDEMIKELKKEKFEIVPTKDGMKQMTTEEEYEFQFAWERQAQFLNAQSRAISELRNSINQFIKLADEADERRLKLEQMQLSIDKTNAEIDRLTDDGDDDAPFEIVIKRKGDSS